jgi:hypothetical protein
VETDKERIFSIFLKCQNELEQRQENIGQLWDSIIKWGKKYLKINTNEMGKEIFDIIRRILKNEDTRKKINNKDEFFFILNKSLKRGEAEYFQKYETSSIKIPKGKKSLLRNVEDYIRMMESNLGRKLTTDELIQNIPKWFKNLNYQEYIELKKLKYVGRLSFTNANEDNEIDILNSTVIQPYSEEESGNPQDEFLLNLNTEIICKAVKTVMGNKQERTRNCNRALFTLFCINKAKDIEGLYSVLDHEIINSCQKDGIKPKQKEIYLKYHPEIKESGADVRASQILKDFINDLKSYLKEKNPEIFS